MSSLFSGPTSITPWIEQAVFDALVQQQQQPTATTIAKSSKSKLVQVVALGTVTTPQESGLIPSCMKISDGKTQILVALSPETRHDLLTNMLPTRGCVVRIAAATNDSNNDNDDCWKVCCVSWLCQTEGFSTRDFQWNNHGPPLGVGINQRQQQHSGDNTTASTIRNNNNNNDALCLYVTGRVETLGGHGMAIAGNPLDVHAALDVRRALQSFPANDPAILQKRLGLLKEQISSSLDDDDDRREEAAARTTRASNNKNNDRGANLPIGDVVALFNSTSSQSGQAALAGINAAAAAATGAVGTKKVLHEESQQPPPPPPPCAAPKPAPPPAALVNGGFSGLRLDGRGPSSSCPVVTDPLQMKNLFGSILEAGKQQKNIRNSRNTVANESDDKMRRQQRRATEYGDDTIAATFEKRLADLIGSPSSGTKKDILDHFDSLADAAFLKWFANKIKSSTDPESKFALQNIYDAIMAVKPKKLDKERTSERAPLGARDKRILLKPPPPPSLPREEMPEGDEEEEEEEEILGIGDMLVSQDDEEEQDSGAVGMTVSEQQRDAELKEYPKDAADAEPEVSKEKGGEHEEETKHGVDEYVQGVMKAQFQEKSDDESEEESEPGLETQCPLVFQGDDETEMPEVAESRKRPLADASSDEGVASEMGSEGLAPPSGKKAVRELTMERWLRLAGTVPATARQREERIGRLAGEGIRLWLASHIESDV